FHILQSKIMRKHIQPDRSPGTGCMRLHFVQELLNFCQIIALCLLKASIDGNTTSLLIYNIGKYIPTAESSYFARIGLAIIKLLQNGNIGIVDLFVAIDVLVIRLACQNLIVARIRKDHLIRQINLTSPGSVAMDCTYLSYGFAEERHECLSARYIATVPIPFC